MTLDPISILLTSTAVASILTGMMAYYRFTRKVYAGFTHWLLGDVFVTVSFLLIALRGILPDFFSVLLGNVLLILSLVVLHQGIRRFFGETSQDRFNIAVFIFFSATFGYFVYIEDSMPMRIVFASLTLSILMYRAGALLFKAPEGLKSSARPGSLMMWATGAFFLARAVDAILNFATYDLFSPRLINVLGFMMGAVLVSTWTFGFFFLNSARLEQELEAVQEKLRKQVITDTLTGIYNRRHFFEHARLEFQRARRYGRLFSILMIDVDEFKSLNDTYGHAAGDKALQDLVGVVRANMRNIDTYARLGGEEFAALLLEVDLKNAMQTAERIRAQVEQKYVQFEDHSINITISIGVAVLQAEDKALESVLHRADQALYRAKQRGRNCISD